MRAAAALLAAALLAPHTQAEPCDRPRCALTPMIAKCNDRGHSSSVERDPCRFVCSSSCGPGTGDPYCMHKPRTVYSKRLPEKVCEDLP